MKNDPLCPLEVITMDTYGDHIVHSTLLNQAYCGDIPVFGVHTQDQYQATLHEFRQSCEQYRTTALSVTGVFIGASLTDQGSIVSAQMSDPHVDMAYWPKEPDTRHDTGRLQLYGIGQPIPPSDIIILGTTPYVSSAREGFYVPYKMEDPDHWHNADNIHYVVRFATDVDGSINMSSAEYLNYPYGNGEHDNLFRWLPPLDEGVSVTWIKGLAKTTTFRITTRINIEVMTRPTSRLASFCEPPALPDEHAIAMYREIVTRMKDAYPAKDNDTGNLWNRIKAIASGLWDTVSPALAAALPGGKAIVTGVNMAKKYIPRAIDSLASRGKSSRPALPAPKKQPKAKSSPLANAAASAKERAGAGSSRGRRNKKAKSVNLIDL